MTKKYLVKKSWFAAGEGTQLLEDRSGHLRVDPEGESAIVVYWTDIKQATLAGYIEEVKGPSRFRAKNGETYWRLLIANSGVKTVYYAEEGDEVDDIQHDTGNYFRSEETSEKVAKTVRRFFEFLHTPYSDDYSVSPLHSAMNEARAAVLADNERQ